VIELRSYRRVFELERRIYRIDRLRLNPGGVPVRGIVYFLVLTAISVLAAGLPLLAPLSKVAPWYVRALVMPGLLSALLALINLEGRPFHLAARALLGYEATPRRLAGLARRTSVGGRWLPGEIVLLPDGSDARVRRMRYIGPGAVLVTVAHERSVRRAALPWGGFGWQPQRGLMILRELAHAPGPVEGEAVVLARGARLATAYPGHVGRGERRRSSASGSPC
jgi:hypothetical protein